MSFAERSIVAELLTFVSVISLFAWILTSRHAAGLFDGPQGLMHWARTVLWMIPVGIVVAIITTLLWEAGYRLVTRDGADELTDERDRLIAGFGWKVTSITASTGFLLALGALALGYSVLVTLNLMLVAFALSDLTGNLAKLLRYRLGG